MSTQRRMGWGSVTAEVVPSGTALMVGLGGRLGVLCVGTILDLGLRGAAVASVDAAIARIRASPPSMVIVPGTLVPDERRAIADAAADAGAELVELPPIVDQPTIAHAVAHALAKSARRSHVADCERGDSSG